MNQDLDHDYFCYDFQPQPALNDNGSPFTWVDSIGKKHKAYPDCWSVFLSGKEILWQIKHSSKLLKLEQTEKWQQETKALRKECSRRGWELKIITEHEIRTSRLNNIQYLRGAALHPPKEEFIENIISLFSLLLKNDKGRSFTDLSTRIQKKNPVISESEIKHVLRYSLYYQILKFDWTHLRWSNL